MIIGLTGPMGAGKSTAAKILHRLGAYIIDADRIGHLILYPQSTTWGQVVKAFGSKILKRGGQIDRRKFSEIIFSDLKKLKKLNSIMHPKMKEIIKREADDALAAMPGRLVVISAAVLKELGLISFVDQVWVISASREKRFCRIKTKKKLKKEQILKRLKAQLPEKEYLKMADVVIKNDGSFKRLKLQIQMLVKGLQ